jgi:hypothetical protein
MRIFGTLSFLVAAWAGAAFASGGVLEKVTKIQVDPTVVEQPDKVDDNIAPNLVRYNLRAALRDAHLEEGDSPIRAHMILSEYSSESSARKVLDMGSGRSVCTVDGRLVVEDASGKELASVKIHVHGTAVFADGTAIARDGRKARSDLEQRLFQEIEKLK